MEISVLGISGSSVKHGNVQTFLHHMVESVGETVSRREIVSLAEYDMGDCIHCNFCLKKHKPDRYCSLDDGAQELFRKIEAADIIILASPVYFMRTSALMAALIDRLRVFVFGNEAGGKLKNKIGVSAAVAWARHGGLETTHLTHIHAFMALEMIPVSVHHCISPLGASAVSTRDGLGLFEKDIRLGVELDQGGLHSGRAMMARAVELCELIRGGSSC